jgi:hypothetical protein
MVEPNRAQKEKVYLHKPENWVSLVTLILVLTYTGVQIWQTILLRRNNVVSQRAFVYVDAPNLQPAINSKDGTTKFVNVFIPFINSGNTATRDLTLFVRCAPSADAMPEPWVLLYREKFERVPQIIGPHQTVMGYCNFPLSQLQQMKEGKLRGYLMGEIIYRDRLEDGVFHNTQFAWEIIDVNIIETPQNAAFPNVSLNFQSRGQHNCADEDCPK